MVQKLQHNVTIKGTKDGLVLLLDDKCSFDLLVEELNDKLTAGSSQMLNGPVISVKVKAGNRYLTAEQEEKLLEVLKQKENLFLDHIESEVITKAEAEEMRKDAQVVTVSKVVRSGQVLDIQGDLLLIGDVNPGATVMATGNIYILGSLKGIAHCGTKGNEEAIIAASVMKPSQLRIAHHINRAPDSYPELGNEMEFAYISNEEKQIRIDRISAVHRLRPKLNSLL
ncbi:septum site-determining protein MinC [Fictibacillus norfolkensis]|uniref:Probable septum site-determining protein MinC n=1 Tax=Fictibacillus norfolkensis TaxID=2762233 RepID=A0ABR8SG68_9BACL|nr:septum site-determining protein MinC [Fictibacillus norfolkensis]MBD7962486.1 septum site-determining protein MinC [Fictibacillus norfolkensis]